MIRSRYVTCLSLCLVSVFEVADARRESLAGQVWLLSTSGSESVVSSPASSTERPERPERPGDTVAKDTVINAATIASNSHTQILGQFSNTVGSDYVIGAEDVLEITVWRNADLSKVVQVRPDGKFSMPVIRDVTAVGKTTSQLADEITRKLKEYVQNPVVAVSVREFNSYSIFLLGEVVRPGKYPLKSKTTLLQGITIAGGFTPTAARNQVVIFRFKDHEPGTQTLTASYDDIVLRGGVDQNLELKAGDTVVVPSESMVIFPGR